MCFSRFPCYFRKLMGSVLYHDCLILPLNVAPGVSPVKHNFECAKHVTHGGNFIALGNTSVDVPVLSLV